MCRPLININGMVSLHTFEIVLTLEPNPEASVTHGRVHTMPVYAHRGHSYSRCSAYGFNCQTAWMHHSVTYVHTSMSCIIIKAFELILPQLF
jgi:hypothetical protein